MTARSRYPHGDSPHLAKIRELAAAKVRGNHETLERTGSGYARSDVGCRYLRSRQHGQALVEAARATIEAHGAMHSVQAGAGGKKRPGHSTGSN